MATLGWKPIGDPVQRLCDAIEECESVWGDDPAYKQVLFNLDKVEQELDLLTASPGRRAVLRAAMPSMSGQEPTERGEPPMGVQRG
jgi:hypothetical protein